MGSCPDTDIDPTYHDRETQGNVNCSFSDIVMCNQERALTAESLKFQIPCNLD